MKCHSLMTFLSKKQNTLWAQVSANCFLYNIGHAEHTGKNSLQSHEKVSLALKRPFLWYSLVDHRRKFMGLQITDVEIIEVNFEVNV